MVFAFGAIIAAATLGAFLLALYVLDMPERAALTVSFLTLALAQLWHVFNMREAGSGLFRNEVVENPFVWGALALCTLLIVAAIYAPGLSGVLGMTSPGLAGWTLALCFSVLPLLLGQIAISFRRKDSLQRPPAR